MSLTIKDYPELESKAEVKKKRAEVITALIENDPDVEDSEEIFTDFAVVQLAGSSAVLNSSPKLQAVVRILKVNATGRYRLLARNVKENYAPIINHYIIPGNELNSATITYQAKNFATSQFGVIEFIRFKFTVTSIDEEFKGCYDTALNENKKLING